MGTAAMRFAAAMIAFASGSAFGCGSSDEGESSRSSSGGGAGSLAGIGGGSLAGIGGGATPPAGAQLARCSSDDDCGGGLTCYTFGRYCSQTCATSADCANLGAVYSCYVPMGFGMMGGGAGMAGGAGTGGSANGNCRIECTGPSDTSCPQGLSCIDVGGMMMPTYRCAYPSSMTGGGSGTDGSSMGGSGTAGSMFGGGGGGGGSGGS